MKSISGTEANPVVTLEWSEQIGKRVRTGPWTDQAISTTRKILDAIAIGQWELAAQLVDYWMEEAKIVYVITTCGPRVFAPGSPTRASPKWISPPR